MSPEIQQQDATPATGAPEITGAQLLRLIQKPLENVLEKNVDREVDYEKQWQLLRLRKCDLYVRGLQFIGLDDSNGYADWMPVGPSNTMTGGTDDNNSGLYDYNIDIVDSFRKKYIAILGLRPFYNAVAVADDPQSEIDQKAARQANLCAVWMRAKWGIRVQNISMFDKQFTAGTVYIHNPFVADKQLFGEVEEPNYEAQSVDQPPTSDPLTGAQQPTAPLSVLQASAPKKYPGSGPAFYLYDGTMVTVPFSCRNFKKVPWLVLEKEDNRGMLLQMYGDALRSRMNKTGDIVEATDSAAQEQGKRTRAAMTSLTGTYRPGNDSLWTHYRCWFATFMYEFFPDKDIRDLLYEKFPDGLKISKVGGIIVRIENEAVGSVWGCVPPFPGNTIYQDPVCWGILGNQDIINFLANIAVAREERGLPTAIVQAGLIDTEALASRRYLPNEVLEAVPSFGGSLREAMVSLPTPNKDDGAGASLHAMVMDNTQTLLGLPPTVWGGQSQQETLGGRRLELSQGLMQLAVPGEMVSQGYVEAYDRGCKLIAAHAPKGFAIPVPDDKQGMTSEMLDLEALRAGKYHFESDPQMPMTHGEMVEQLTGIIKENPEMAVAMGLQSPLAAQAVRDYILPGMPDIPSPDADVRDKVVERIQELLRQQPIPGVPDPATGQPGPMLPSIQPEDFVDNPQQHMQLTKEWLNTGAGRKAASDPARMSGYQNVVAYGLLCEQKALPPPMPPPPPKPPSLTVTAKAVDLVNPAVQQILQQDFNLGANGSGMPPPMPQQQGAPPNGMPPNASHGPQHPMAPPTPGTSPMPPASGPMIQ